MSNTAKVESVEAVKAFRPALWKFAEAATGALGDAESEMRRVLTWLETEQTTRWQSEMRKRTEAVVKAKEALRHKRIFKDATGRTPSAVDEEKALAVATRRLQEAEQKLANTRAWARKLPKEIQSYKGTVQRFATSVQSGIPMTVAHLDKLVAALDSYVGLRVAEAGSTTSDVSPRPATAGEVSMARGDVPEESAAAPVDASAPSNEPPPAGS